MFLFRYFSHLKWLFKPAVWLIIPSGKRSTLQFRFQHRKALVFVLMFLTFIGYFLVEGIQQEIRLWRLKFSIANYEKLLPLYQKGIDNYGEISFRFRTELKELSNIVNFFETKNNYNNQQANNADKKQGARGGRDIAIDSISQSLMKAFQNRSDDVVSYDVQDISFFLDDMISHSENINLFLQRRNKFARSLPTLCPINVSMGYNEDSSNNEQISIKSLYGLEMVAAGDGTVLNVIVQPNLLTTVFIDHGYGYVTEYHGLIVSFFEKGDSVVKGKRVGLTSDNLTYKVKLADEYQNPKSYLLVSY